MKARTFQDSYYEDDFGQDVFEVCQKGKNGSSVTRIYTSDKKIYSEKFLSIKIKKQKPKPKPELLA